MNDFSELEADARKLRPRPASADFLRRVEQAMDALPTTAAPTAGLLPRPRAHGWWSLGLGLTGVAALLVLGLTFFDQRPIAPSVALAPSPAKAPAGFQPASLSQVVYSGRDEGLVFPPDDSGAPRRRLRYETRETMRWRNARTGASVRVSYPVEQVVLAPVAFQ
jgi:hypothetical protein